MGTTALAFLILWLSACGYALARGGPPERIVAAVLLAAALLTSTVTTRPGAIYATPEAGLLVVDATLLVLLVGIALRSSRYWPLLMASMQGVAVLGHVAKLLAPDITPLAYFVLTADWGFPMLLLLLAGTLRHERRVSQRGWDPSWTRDLPTDYRHKQAFNDERKRAEPA